jgi:hypothetical protein
MQKKPFITPLFVVFVAVISFTTTTAMAQVVWPPEEVLVGVWGKVKVWKGTDGSRAFPYLVNANDSTYTGNGCTAGKDYVYEYKLIGDLSKLTREMFSYLYLPSLEQTIPITGRSGGTGVQPWCEGDDKFKWGAGFCDKDVLVLQPQPARTGLIWFCSPHGDTGPIDVAVGTSSLQPGKNVILGPGFLQSYLPVTTEQLTKVSNVCLKTIQNRQTKCIEQAYYAKAPITGECSDVTTWLEFTDYGPSGAIYTGTPNASEACDQTLEIPPQEYLDQLVASTKTVNDSYADALTDKSVSDTQSSCTCPPCIKYTIRGYLKCSCP